MSALDRTVRRKIYYLMVALFLLVAPAVILYSRGYLIDFRSMSFVSTGGIFVKTLQPEARVFLDHEFIRETSFISRGALLSSLLPGRYTLRVEREGGQPWAKVVHVRSGQVIEFRNIFLPPATLTPQAIYAFTDEEKVSLLSLDGRSEIVIQTSQAGKFTLAIIDSVSGRTNSKVSGVNAWKWDANGRQIYFNRKIGQRVVWYRLGLNSASTGEEERVVFRGMPRGFSPEVIIAHPVNPKYLYFLAGGGLFLQTAASVPTPIAEQVYAFTVSRDKIYFISRSGFFVQSNLEGSSSFALGRKGLFLDQARPVEFFSSDEGVIAMIDSAGGLFVYRPGEDQELQFVAGNVKGVDFGKESDRMLFWDDHKISFFWFYDNRRQPFQLTGTKEEILKSAGVIRRAFLGADGAYVFYATAEGIVMSEVDSRVAANIYDLVESELNDFVLDKDSLAIVWASANKIFRTGLK